MHVIGKTAKKGKNNLTCKFAKLLNITICLSKCLLIQFFGWEKNSSVVEKIRDKGEDTYKTGVSQVETIFCHIGVL